MQAIYSVRTNALHPTKQRKIIVSLQRYGKHTSHLLKQEEILHFGHILYVIPTFIQPTTDYLLKKLYFIQWRTQEFCSVGSINSVEDRGQRERGSGGGSPVVRGSGGSCNLVQAISFHIVKCY